MPSTGRLGLIVVATLLLLPAASSGTMGSGLYGVVRKGPVTPVCLAGVPCDTPARVKLAFSSTRPGGGTGYRIRTSTKGRYRIALPPGIYEVSTRPSQTVGKPIKPHGVHVRAGHWDRINFFIDTGIR